MADYIVWCPDLGHEGLEDGQYVEALGHEDAAKRWAKNEDRNSAEYWIVGGGGTRVTVVDELGVQESFFVFGQQEIFYAARALQ